MDKSKSHIYRAHVHPLIGSLQALRVVVVAVLAGVWGGACLAPSVLMMTHPLISVSQLKAAKWRRTYVDAPALSPLRDGAAAARGRGGRGRTGGGGGNAGLRSGRCDQSRRGVGVAAGASNTRRADDNVIVPERVGVAAVRLPAEVDARGLGLDGAARPRAGVGVGDARPICQTRNHSAVQPGLNGAVGADVVLKALPVAGGQGGRGGNTLRRELGEGSIVRLAVVHQDRTLPADTKVLVGTLGGVWHGNEGDMRGGKGLGRLTTRAY